jgi:hypothetical protein
LLHDGLISGRLRFPQTSQRPRAQDVTFFASGPRSATGTIRRTPVTSTPHSDSCCRRPVPGT